MSFHVHQILSLSPLQNGENVLELSSEPVPVAQSVDNVQSASTCVNPQPAFPWTPSDKFLNIRAKFESYILYQYPCVPCSYCGKLLYPEKAKWIQNDESYLYPLKQAYPNIELTMNPSPPIGRTAVCDSCKKDPGRNFPPYLDSIPDEIQRVPLHKRKYLSPIYLHSSLGRISDLNQYSEYRSIVGTIDYSKNVRSLTLYSGILGAFL